MLSRLGRVAIVAVVCLNWGSPAWSQLPPSNPNRQLNWAEKMFSQLSHDFGTVARGADARHLIELTNLYEEDISIASVNTTCGCTAAKPDRNLLKTHEKAYIEVKMNTVKFTHRKDSNVDVTLTFHGANGSATRTVRVPITAYIRTDVVLTPGNVDFGSVEFGRGAEQLVEIAYAGRDSWKIQEVKTGSDRIRAEIQEISRGNGRVKYELRVRLSPEARLGNVQDQITLITDDGNARQVPVLVFGQVDPDIAIVPSTYRLGNLRPGEQKQFMIVVKGKQPFVIENIERNSNRDWFEVMNASDQEKNVHQVPFRVTAPVEPGPFSETFSFTIKDRTEPITFTAEGTIVSAP